MVLYFLVLCGKMLMCVFVRFIFINVICYFVLVVMIYVVDKRVNISLDGVLGILCC